MRRPSATAGFRLTGNLLQVARFCLRGRHLLAGGRVFGLLLTAVVAGGGREALALEASGLDELSQLARAGAPQLALRRMEEEQPDAAQNPALWMAWERERLQILNSQGLYRELIQRVDALPDNGDEHLYREAMALKAEARLQLAEAEQARDTARDLLWFHVESAEAEQIAGWRRLVVRSYVLEDRIADARLALARYRQDFGDENPEWRWLSARVFLQSEQAPAAVSLLQEDSSPQGQLLRYAAQLQVAPQDAAAIEQSAVDAAAQVGRPALQGAFLALAAAAAGQDRRPLDEIRHLERALSLPVDSELTHAVVEARADRLWDLYLDEGQAIGNREQRLLGSDEDWYLPAVEAQEKDPLRARLLFAVLAEHGASVQSRWQAHERLVEMLDALPDGKVLVRRLYLEAQRYADVERLPRVIRYRLIDEALESGDLETASRLMEGLEAPPDGSNQLEWNLRRARVAIFTADIDAGVRLLRQLVESDEEWDADQLDRVLQVVFDLQTVKNHRQALELFGLLAQKPLELQQRRELLFWMADSLKALERYDEAAYLYLKSATLADPLAMDPWAQTARYRAARALVDAGLLDDARRIYTSLLRASNDKSRRAVLQNEIQSLRLMRAAGEGGAK